MDPRSLEPRDLAGLGEPLRIPPDPARLERVREIAARAAERFGLDSHSCFRFKLAASEAVANAIEHGAPTADGTLHIWVRDDATKLVFRVRDGGRYEPARDRRGALPDRGRGIPLMASSVDDLRIDSDGGQTTVTLTKHRPQAA